MSSSSSSTSNTTTLIATPPTPSPVNYEQVNNFFLSIEQFLRAQTNDLPLSYSAPYQQITTDETSPIQRFVLFDHPSAQLRTTLIGNSVAIADFDLFRENWALYLHLQHTADQRFLQLQNNLKNLNEFPLPTIHQHLLYTAARRVQHSSDPSNQNPGLSTGSNSGDTPDDSQETDSSNDEPIGCMETGNASEGTGRNLDDTRGNSELRNPRNAPPFITDNTQCFVCGRRDHFLDQCADYVCKRCNRRNPGHYKKFCLLQP